MPRLGRNPTDPEPWIEQMVLSYGSAIPPDRAVKAIVIGARDLTESQDETDASCVIFLSDGVVFIPAVLTTQAWSRLQDMEERESYSGLENAIVCVKNLQLNFHMEPELASCQFYVTVNRISTVGQGSTHDPVPNCATLPSVKEQIHSLWGSRVEESSSQSQYGFRLTDLLEEWERDGGTQISPSEVIARPTPLSEPITSHHSMNLPTHYTMNTPPGPSAATHNMNSPSETTPSHCMMDLSVEPSSSHHIVAPHTSCQTLQSLEDGSESEDTRLLRRIIERLAPPAVPVSDGDVTTPTPWHQNRLSYKAEECFSVPVHYLLIPEDQREKMITMATAASTSSSTPSGMVPPPLPDRQTDQPIATQPEGPDQLPSSGERMDDSPRSSVLVDAESVHEGGAWDIFAPMIDMLKSPSSSELSATPEDLPLLQSQSLSVLPENLPLLQSQSNTATARNLPLTEVHSDSATPENLPITKSSTDSDTPEDLLLTKIQSDSATPENLPLVQTQSASATPKTLPLLQGLTSVRTPDNLKHQDSQSGSTSSEKFPLHQSLLARLSSAPIGTSTQNVLSSGSGAEKTSLPPYQPSLPLDMSLSQLSGKHSTPHPSPEDEGSAKATRSPPSWIAHPQQTGSNHSQTGSQPKRRMFASPSKQSWVHSDGSAFSYKYQASVQDICALGQFTVPAEMIQWSVRYLLGSPHTSTEEQGHATGSQKL